MITTLGMFLPPLITTASALNRHFIDEKDSFPEYVKEVLSDFTVNSIVWDSLNDDVKTELLELGYKPESSK